MSNNTINLEYLLNSFTSNENPFLELSIGLNNELFGVSGNSTFQAGMILVVLLSLSLLISLTTLMIRIYKSDRRFYKLQSTSFGSLIVPNRILNYLFYSILFSSLSIVYVFYSFIVTGSITLFKASLLKSFIFLPFFFALVNTSWGIITSSYSQHKNQVRRINFSPLFLNIFFLTSFISVLLAFIPSILVIHARFNNGFQAYEVFNLALGADDFKNVSVTSLEAGVEAVRLLIPGSDTLIEQMSNGIYSSNYPFQIEIVFSFLLFFISILTTYYSLKSFNSLPTSNENDTKRSEELKSSSEAQRRNSCIAGIIGSFASLLYIISSLISNVTIPKSPIFNLITRDSQIVDLILLYVLSIVNISIVIHLLYQTISSNSSSFNFNNSSKSLNLTSFPPKSTPYPFDQSTNANPNNQFNINLELHSRRNSRSIDKDLELNCIPELDEEELAEEDFSEYKVQIPRIVVNGPVYDVGGFQMMGVGAYMYARILYKEKKIGNVDRSCPVVRMGKLCIEVDPTKKIAYISEELCIGCGICPKKCPFEAIYIIKFLLN